MTLFLAARKRLIRTLQNGTQLLELSKQRTARVAYDRSMTLPSRFLFESRLSNTSIFVETDNVSFALPLFYVSVLRTRVQTQDSVVSFFARRVSDTGSQLGRK